MVICFKPKKIVLTIFPRIVLCYYKHSKLKLIANSWHNICLKKMGGMRGEKKLYEATNCCKICVFSSSVSDFYFCLYLLDIFVVFAELLIVEPKLVHKVGRHLLDLIVWKGLEWGQNQLGAFCAPPPTFLDENAAISLFFLFVLLSLPAGGTGRWGMGSPCRRLRWTSACCGCSPAGQSGGIHTLKYPACNNKILLFILVKPWSLSCE